MESISLSWDNEAEGFFSMEKTSMPSSTFTNVSIHIPTVLQNNREEATGLTSFNEF